jgi:AraC-like DNA-binding protein
MIKVLICLFLVLITLPAKAEKSFSANDYLWTVFDDSIHHGHSKNVALDILDYGVQWIFGMDTGSPWPYVGLSAQLEKPGTSLPQYFYLGENDSLIMELSSNEPGRVTVQLATFDKKHTKLDDPVSYRVVETAISVTTEKRRIAIPLRQFKVAEWWKIQYNVAPEDNELLLDSTKTIDLVIGDLNRIGQRDTLTIYSFEFKRHTSRVTFLLIILFPLFLLSGVFTFLWLKKREKNTLKTIIVADETIRLQPVPVFSGPSDWERVITYLEQNYSNAELTLGCVAAEFGFSESRLSRLIAKHYPDGFRSLIHGLRISEAKRLLGETSLNVAEIAYKIGYATPSHFNREFKLREKLTPTGYRKEFSRVEL